MPNHSNTLIITLMATLIVMTVIAMLFIFILLFDKKIRMKNQQILTHEKNLLSAAISAGEKEKTKIANDLHDDLGMLIHALKMKLDQVKNNISSPQKATSHLNESHNLFEKIIQSLRNISGNILPAPLTRIGLIAGCHYLADEINKIGLHSVEINNSNWSELEIKQNHQLYFILKELLNNIIKHSGANKTTIDFKKENQKRKIILKSNSKGISNAEVLKIISSTERFGLKGIFGRALLIGAEIDFSHDHLNNAIINITFKKQENTEG